MGWLPFAMVALSAAQADEKQRQAAKERQAQAAMTRYSPWTGMAGHTVQDPSLVGGLTQGLGSGLALQQSQNTAAQNKDFANLYKQFLQSKVGATAKPGEYNSSGMDAAAPASTGMSEGLQNASLQMPTNTASPYSFSGIDSSSLGSAGALQGAGQGVMQNPQMMGSFWDLLSSSGE